MPHILMIATGGTIACCETAHGLSPALDSAALLGALPELSALCTVETLDLMQLDSTDVTAADRQHMAQAVWQNREKFDGFVLTHGTDSDAPRNLLDAFRTAADGRAGVYAVMNGQILHGSHVFKQHSTEIDAFLSANAAPAGEIRESEVRWNTPAPVPSGEPKLVEQIDTHILPVRLTPDLDPSFFSVLLGYPKVILEAFGAGGVPARLESAVRDLIQSGTRVYITTQCPEGGVHLHKYEVGRRAEALGAISLGSRTFEDALGALMCGEL